MDRFDASTQYGWIDSAQAWLDTVEIDANRTQLLDPLLIDLCGNLNGMVVVDFGCGEGRFCRMLSEKGAYAIGIDPVETFLRFGKSADSKSRLVRGSGEAAPIASSSTDLVVAYLSLIDIPDFRKAISEMARVLKPGGRVLIANVHSMASALPGWHKDETGKRLFWRVDEYFKEEGELAAWNGIEVLNWHRPLEAYMQALLSIGLKLESFIEPRPELHIAEANPSIADHRRVPNFVVMVWSKP